MLAIRFGPMVSGASRTVSPKLAKKPSARNTSKARSASVSLKSIGSQRATSGRIASTRLRNTRRISGSTIHTPKSSVVPTRSVDRSTCFSGQNEVGSTGYDSGSSGLAPTLAANSSAVSATSRPIGPSTEITDQPSARALSATRPGVGRSPTTPHRAAGMRSEPPVSEPVQIGSMPVASAAAEPPEEPPALSVGLNGLPVAPQTGLRELAPAPMSGTLVLAVTMAPAARSLATIAMSAAGTLPRRRTLP